MPKHVYCEFCGHMEQKKIGIDYETGNDIYHDACTLVLPPYVVIDPENEDRLVYVDQNEGCSLGL